MVFFLLIVIVVFACFVVVLNRTTTLRANYSQTRQVDLDKGDEQLIVSSQSTNDFFNIDTNAKTVTVNCMLSNTGTLPVEIVRLWVQDATNPEKVESSPIPTDEVIGEGQAKPFSNFVTFSSSIQAMTNSYSGLFLQEETNSRLKQTMDTMESHRWLVLLF